jgi:hypothetical protein
MQRLVGKITLSLVLLGMSSCLLWYAVGTSSIATRDFEFIRRHSSLELLPEASFWLGSQAYYEEVNPAKAAGYFREAIAGQVLLVDAWFGLAKAELALGHEEVAHRVLNAIAPAITQVSTWKWQEFLLAFDLRDEAKFDATFNFILARLPVRVGEAFQLALRYWGSYAAILPHVIPENRTVCLQELMNAKAIDEALSLWMVMRESSPAPKQDLSFRFCEFLLNNGRVADAKELWKGSQGDRDLGVYDGGFEREPLNMAFGWRVGRLSEVDIERTRVEPYEGSSCLHLYFHGKKNIDFSQVFQILPVEPGQRIRLRFATKSRNISTDQGVFVEVNGYHCSGLHVQSKPVTGTKAWDVEELDVPVPLGCEAIVVQLRRKESLMFDNKIIGDYWLDAVTSEFDRIQH